MSIIDIEFGMLGLLSTSISIFRQKVAKLLAKISKEILAKSLATFWRKIEIEVLKSAVLKGGF